MLKDAGIDTSGPAHRVPNASNEVWEVGPYIVRLGNRPSSRRLAHEATVIGLLPPEARHPGVVAHGRNEVGEWIIVNRVPGDPLSKVWLKLNESQRARAVGQLATAMRAIHGVRPGSALEPPFLAPGSLECPHQLPLERLADLIDRASTMPGIDPGLVRAAERQAGEWGTALGDEPDTLVHGDFHLENVLFVNDVLTAVVDFEFARPTWPEVDLEILLRFCEQPQWHVAADYRDASTRDSFRKVVRHLREAYPQLFSDPRLTDRLNLFSLSYDLRDLVLQPTPKPGVDLPPFHPLNRLTRLLDGRGTLQLIDW